MDTSIGGPNSLSITEAPAGIETTNGGFADLCLTTWLRRRGRRSYPTQTALRKSFRYEGLSIPGLHQRQEKCPPTLRRNIVLHPPAHGEQVSRLEPVLLARRPAADVSLQDLHRDG